MNTIVHVDRSTKLVYPQGIENVTHPELQELGPSEYDLAAIQLYLHPRQKQAKERGVDGWMSAADFLRHLEETDLLPACLGIHDAVAIRKKGCKCFAKLFAGNTLCFWKSAAFHESGFLLVPTVGISMKRNKPSLYLYWYALGCNTHFPAARFRREVFASKIATPTA